MKRTQGMWFFLPIKCVFVCVLEFLCVKNADETWNITVNCCPSMGWFVNLLVMTSEPRRTSLLSHQPQLIYLTDLSFQTADWSKLCSWLVGTKTPAVTWSFADCLDPPSFKRPLLSRPPGGGNEALTQMNDPAQRRPKICFHQSDLRESKSAGWLLKVSAC